MSDKTSALKLCPCCGHDNIYEVTETEELTGVTIPALFCNSCKIIFKVKNDSPYLEDNKTFEYMREKTIKAWNNRKPMERILERLKKECIEIEDAINSLSFEMYRNQDARKKAMQLREWSIFLHRLRNSLKEEGGLND